MNNTEFNIIYTKYNSALRHYIQSIYVGSPSNIDDILQNVWMSILKSKNLTLTKYPNIFPILRHLISYRIIDFYKKNDKKNVYFWGKLLHMPDISHSPQLDLLDLFECLPQQLQKCSIMVLLQGYTYKEVSDLLNIPFGTVLSRVYRAKLKLRKWALLNL